MTYNVKVLADSISPRGIRLTTFEATYPRIVHAEQMTHRVIGRNSASTRAIPLATQLWNLITNPFVPERFGINQPGMQAYRHLEGLKHEQAVEIWLNGRDRAITTVLELILGTDMMRDLFHYEPGREYIAGIVLRNRFEEVKGLLPKSTDDTDLSQTSMLNVHKQLAGRGLETYMWHTIIMTATELGNYIALRDHPEAQGEIAELARLLRLAYNASQPRHLEPGQWHLPLVDEGEFESVGDAIKASAARCAAVSYNRQAAKNPDKEFQRYAELRGGGHMSPLEHQATPFNAAEWRARDRMAMMAKVSGEEDVLAPLVIRQLQDATRFCGNLRGWRQHRKQVEGEDDFRVVRG